MARAVSPLVVPGPWIGRPLSRDACTVSSLHDRVAGGDEVVLHGWAHPTGPLGPACRHGPARILAPGDAKFAGLLDAEAYGRVVAGVGVPGELGLPATGLAPGGLAPHGTVRALSRVGLRCRLSRRAVHGLGGGTRRPVARRGASCTAHNRAGRGAPRGRVPPQRRSAGSGRGAGRRSRAADLGPAVHGVPPARGGNAMRIVQLTNFYGPRSGGLQTFVE